MVDRRLLLSWKSREDTERNTVACGLAFEIGLCSKNIMYCLSSLSYLYNVSSDNSVCDVVNLEHSLLTTFM
jgi:hypothetical protein